ncbi:MAG: zinc ribbon domain-containing protein [Dehalococcoidia bacterium]|nr:zinc ribbon domain-containing protein [Dehalococcoidia bacterium]
MPMYEYFCRRCNAKFEVLRSMDRSDDAAACPAGHAGAVRTLSVFAPVGRTAPGGSYERAAPGGGCACGGACSCGGH